MEVEHYIEFNLDLSLSDTIETEGGISEEALESLKKEMKDELFYSLKDYLRRNTTYEVSIS